MSIRHVVIATVAAVGLAACGGSDEASSTTVAESSSGDATGVEVPDGATLCGVFVDEYDPILKSPTAFGEPGWDDEAQELVRLANVLEQLAPAEQAARAADNVGYFQALADVESASDFVEGSNAFNLYLASNC